jgi:hypothetical protein
MERIGTMKARILAILGAFTLAIGFGIGSGQAAYAVGPVAQYCDSGGYCMNAWNEGPYISAYTETHVNNNFSAFKNRDGYETIEYLGPGPYQHQCIGDYGNNPNDAHAALYGFCDSGQIAWGANFTVVGCGNNTYAFKDVHWKGGYLTPNSNSDGSPFFLNSATPTCYRVLGPG